MGLSYFWDENIELKIKPNREEIIDNMGGWKIKMIKYYKYLHQRFKKSTKLELKKKIQNTLSIIFLDIISNICNNV